MTKPSKIFNQFIFIVIVLPLILQSCYQEKITTINFYIIDNQSSYELTYYVLDDDEFQPILIPIGETTEIDALGDAFTDRIPAEEGFDLIAKNINKDVFLYRDSSGYNIEALQLNTTGILNWEEEMRSPNRFGKFNDYTLIVTDEMIN